MLRQQGFKGKVTVFRLKKYCLKFSLLDENVIRKLSTGLS